MPPFQRNKPIAFGKPVQQSREKVREPAEQRPEWSKGKVRLSMVSTDTQRYLYSETTDALILGNFAVHSKKNQTWILTHVPTGLIVCSAGSENDAQQIGEYLRSYYYYPFLLKTQKEVCSATPLEVRQWLLRCSQERKFLPFDE